MSGKVYATIPKGMVRGFESTVLQRNLLKFSLSLPRFCFEPTLPIFWLENNYNVPVARCLYFSLLIVLHQLKYHYSTENSAREQRIDISFQNSMTKIKKGLHANVGPII